MTVEIKKNFISEDLATQIYLESKSTLENSFGYSGGYRESFENLFPQKNPSKEFLADEMTALNIPATEENISTAYNICNILFEIKKTIEDFYNEPISEVHSSLVKMLKGAKNELHSDMYLLDGSEWHGGRGNRSSLKYSAILYLSTFEKHFGGGEIVFPNYNLSFKPEAGSLVFFSGDIDHKHYVPKITYGERLSLVVFLRPESA